MDNKLLTGVIMLEAFWSTSKKDMLDLVTPFVLYSVGKTTRQNEAIDMKKVSSCVFEEFGYKDLPYSVIERILNRNRDKVNKENKKYYIIGPLDDIITSFEKNKEECQYKIQKVSQSLYEYLKGHCKKTSVNNPDFALNSIYRFFDKYGLSVETDAVYNNELSPATNEVNYYISRYIFDLKDSNKLEYQYVLDIAKGFLIKTAIYYQSENDSDFKTNYKNLKVFYDTPFLIKLLGYQSEQEAVAARQLHDLLDGFGAQFYYFPQTEIEIINILTAYQHALIGERISIRTLQGLDAQKYDYDSVERLKKTITKTLDINYNVKSHEIPSYATNEDGSVDISKVQISESDITEYIRVNTSHYTDSNLKADVDSGLAIHRLRNGYTTNKIENCKAIFVTTNTDFTKAFNNYYSKNVSKGIVMPVILDSVLTAITWVKHCDINSDVPESQLLVNAYSAQQPSYAILSKSQEIMTQMETEGSLDSESAMLLRADKVIQKELWIEEFPDINSIDQNYIEKLKQKQMQKTEEAIQSKLFIEYNEKEKQSKEQFIKKCDKKAREDARIAKEKRYLLLKRIAITFCIIVLIMSSIGFIQSLKETQQWSIPSALLAFLSFFGIIDTITERKILIDRIINRLSNQYETEVYEKRKKEYKSIIE